MTILRQGQYSTLEEQAVSAVFATNFFTLESFVFGIIPIRQKKITFIFILFSHPQAMFILQILKTNIYIFQVE